MKLLTEFKNRYVKGLGDKSIHIKNINRLNFIVGSICSGKITAL